MNANIIMYGAGAIGCISTPEVLKSINLLSYIYCYIDNDKSKQGTEIETCGKKYEVKSPQYLKECSDRTIILINVSRFSDVIIQLEEMKCTEEMICYIIPMMLIHNFCTSKSIGYPQLTKNPIIPKTIHYMWLGEKSIPKNLQKNIDSWKKFCPEYEIVEWNENNYDIDKHIYMREALNSKAYGFVPDYARLDIIYNEGGFYLDTDVEIKKSIDPLRYQEAFCGVEKWQIINFGGLSGAIKGHPMIKAFIDSRENIRFCNSDGSFNKNTCGYYDTITAINNGYKINGKTQNINGMNIYAYDYFHPFDYMSGTINETSNTYSVHWFNGGWLDDNLKSANEKTRSDYLDLYKKSLI